MSHDDSLCLVGEIEERGQAFGDPLRRPLCRTDSSGSGGSEDETIPYHGRKEAEGTIRFHEDVKEEGAQSLWKIS